MLFGQVPISGTASDVVGMDSATRFKNTVNDNRIVTPADCAVTKDQELEIKKRVAELH